jgi:small-conductance mechanosensitive channel
MPVICIGQTIFTKSQVSTSDTIVTKKAVPYQLSEINYALEQTEHFLSLTKYQINSGSSISQIESDFGKARSDLQKEYADFREHRGNQYARYFLENSFFIWQEHKIRLAKWQKKVSGYLILNQQKKNDIDKILEKWELTLNDPKIADQPEQIIAGISSMIGRIRLTQNDLSATSDYLLTLENSIAEEVNYCNNIIENITNNQLEIFRNFLIAEAPELLNTGMFSGDLEHISSNVSLIWRDVKKHLTIYSESENKAYILLLFVASLTLVYLIRYAFLKYTDPQFNSEKFNETVSPLINYSLLSILILFLLNYLLLFPYQPTIITKLSRIILLISAGYIIFGSSKSQGRSFITKLLILLILNYIQFIFLYIGDSSRIYFMLESVAGIVIFLPFLRPGFWKSASHNKTTFIVGLLAVQVLIFYILSAITNFFGYFDITHYLIKTGIHLSVITLIIFALYKIWIALTSAVLSISKNFKTSYLSHFWERIEKRLTRIGSIAIFFLWFLFVIRLFELQRPISLLLNSFLLNKRTIGTLELSFSSILSFLLIISLTFIITGIIRFLIDDDFIKRSKLPRGIAAAISVTLRYMIVVAGTLLALSSAGVEIGKFSLLTGALGIGIGFGLQSIVTNFISGLILVYERPIQVGDTIEVENLIGQVKKIGPRSSQVVTNDGAEIIVPNSNLISNQLINWTLSDNKRRIQIKIDVAYGSDPNKVLRLLNEIAEENSDVLKHPAPLAIFNGFAESSLTFSLYFWTHLDYWMITKSNMSILIYNILTENNIEIPFPQMDLHLKSELPPPIPGFKKK